MWACCGCPGACGGSWALAQSAARCSPPCPWWSWSKFLKEYFLRTHLKWLFLTYQGDRVASDWHQLGDDVHEDCQGEHHRHAWRWMNEWERDLHFIFHEMEIIFLHVLRSKKVFHQEEFLIKEPILLASCRHNSTIMIFNFVLFSS